MNKMRITLLTALLSLALLVGCSAPAQTADVPSATPEPPQTTDTAAAVTEPPAASNALTQADAETIALEHAGVTADQVKFLHSEYEIDDGISQYDVEFYHNNQEFNYEIHAETGEILSFERDD